MSRLVTRWWLAWLLAAALGACVQPTPTPENGDVTAPPGTTPASLPVGEPTLPPGTGYPAPNPTRTSAAYPPGSVQVVATSTAPAAVTAAPSATTAPSATAAPTATTGPVVITYRDFEIVPAETTITAGTTVNFVIEDSVHQPYAGAAAPFIFEAPANLSPGTIWQATFNTPRTMTILCGYHSNMTATLIVEP
jgi:plastocyanin